MKSQLLKSLLAEAQIATDRVAWARAICRAAAHYARHGDVKHAANKIGLVRAEFESHHNPEVGIWLMLAEGIAHFFEVRPTEAYDRTRRAYALARAFCPDELALPTCAAWMAHLEFNRGDYDRMIHHLEELLQRPKSVATQASSRAALVIADAYHFGGSFKKAQPWYEKCRRYATAEEDDATLSALFHNVAAFRASNVRLASAFGQSDQAESRRAFQEAESARVFDTLLQGHGLELLFPLLRGQLLSAEGKFSEALGLLDSIDGGSLHARLRPLVLAETAWCQLNLGAKTQCWDNVLGALKIIDEQVDIDDLAYIYARGSQIAIAVGQTANAEQWKSRSMDLIVQHRAIQYDLVTKLDALARRINSAAQ